MYCTHHPSGQEFRECRAALCRSHDKDSYYMIKPSKIRHMWSFHFHPVLRLPYLIVILFLYLPSITARNSSCHDSKPIYLPCQLHPWWEHKKKKKSLMETMEFVLDDEKYWRLVFSLLNSNIMYDTCMQTCTYTFLHVSSRHRFKTSVKTINPSTLVLYSLSCLYI